MSLQSANMGKVPVPAGWNLKEFVDKNFRTIIVAIGALVLVAIVTVVLILASGKSNNAAVVSTPSESATTGTSTNTQPGAVTEDPFGNKTNAEVMQAILDGGNKYGTMSMNATEKKMLGIIEKELIAKGVGIEKVIDANKFVSPDEPSAYWVILFKDKATGRKLVTIVFQANYINNHVNPQWTDPVENLDPFSGGMARDLPTDGLFLNH